MTGTIELSRLVASMSPELQAEIYVFAKTDSLRNVPLSSVLMLFREAEAVTVIMTRQAAENLGLQYQFPCRMITLNIHSALQAVGFLALITGELARAGIAVNPVSGFYHDHLFVSVGDVESTLTVLHKLSEQVL